MKFARYTFWAAAVYGMLVIVPLFFSEQKIGLDYPPALTHAEYYYAFAGVTLVWQLLFIVIALQPVRYRGIMLICVLEKLALVPAFAVLFPQGRFPVLWIPLLVIDLGFAILFFIAYRRARFEQQVNNVPEKTAA